MSNSKIHGCGTSARRAVVRRASQFAIERLHARLLLAGTSADPAIAGNVYLPPQYTVQQLGGFLSGPQKGKALTIAQNYLASNAKKLHILAADVARARVTDQYTDADTGITHIYLRQQYNGLDVANTDLSINVTRDGRIINVGGNFVALPKDSTTKAGKLAGTDALSRAAKAVGLKLKNAPIETTPKAGLSGGRRTFTAKDVSKGTIPAKNEYFATPDGLRLAQTFEIDTSDQQHWYSASVDADTGELLFANDWVDHASYNAIAFPNESLNEGTRSLLTDPNDTTASPYGWHDTNGVAGAEYTTTRGNNAYAYTDTASTNTPGFSPDGGASLNFDFPWDTTTSPSAGTNQSAAVTNLFYAANYLHDFHANYGFTEAAGNFQTKNYSSSGLGSDAVLAEAQDGSGTNNANFATPADGQAPRMQMYLFTSTSPSRDGDFENGIIAHEYGHGVTNRLTGGPSNANALSSLQSSGMGEGWSDFYALMTTQRQSDQQNATYPMGTWVLGQAATGPGIRRYPYSFDMTKNPQTFAMYGGSYGTEVHNTGELWADALWDLNWLLIQKYGYGNNVAAGYDPNTPGQNGGNELALRLVMDGLKLQPANPSFINARDAILAADTALNGGKDLFQIWTAFARRGLGYSAVDSSASATSITSATDLPPALLKPIVLSQSPNTVQNSPLASVDLTFSKAMDPTSFSVADDIASFTGPGGTNLLSQITGSNWLNSNQTLRITFTPQSTEGPYRLVAGPNILAASDASPMDQDSDGTAGEATQDQYTATLYYDALPLQVASTTPASGSLVSLPFTSVDVSFNQPILANSVGTGDLALSQGSVTAATVLDAQTVRYTLSGITNEGTLTLNMVAGAVVGADTFPMVAYSDTFALDVGTRVMPKPARVAPNGSAVYEATSSATIGTAADTDAFTLDLAAGQVLTVVVSGVTSLRPSLDVRDSDGALLGTITATAAGKAVSLQTLKVKKAGIYTITVSGANGTVGAFTVGATLNAAQEIESVDGTTNNTKETAQNIDGSFVALGSQVDRGGVIGSLPSTAGVPIITEDFETGTLGSAWSTYSSDSLGRIALSGSYGPTSSKYALIMDRNDSSGSLYTLNEAIWTVDLTNQPSPKLTFSQTSFGDESDTLATDFTGHANGDGVAISADGTHWHTVWQGDSSANNPTWGTVSVDLAAAAIAAGMTLGADFKIKFQQYDNYAVSTDGRGFDNVAITVPANAADWYSVSLTAGTPIALGVRSASGSGATVSLFDAAGSAVGSGVTAATNLDSYIARYVPSSDGTYYIRVAGGTGAKYGLVVTRNAAFSAQPHNSSATAQPLNGFRAAVGYLGSESGGTSTITLDATYSGWWNISGVHDVANTNYSLGIGSSSIETRDFFIFDLSTVKQNITAAQLVLDNPTNGFASANATESITFWDVSTPLTTLQASGNGATNIFADLGSGTPLGSRTVSNADNGTSIATQLNAEGVMALNSAAGSSFAIGGALDNASGTSPRYVFGYSTGSLTRQLVLSLGNPSDWYSYNVTAAGSSLAFSTSTPNGGPGGFDNTLNLHLELYDPSGNLVASGLKLADGRNESITYQAASTGAYRIRVTLAATSSGEYVLQLGDGLAVSAPANVNESEGSATATIDASTAPTTDLTLTVNSSSPGRIGVPATIVLPAGQTSITLPLSILNNPDLDGSQPVTISVSAPGYFSGATTINVHDDESTALTVVVPADLNEASGTFNGTVSVATAPTRDIVVALASNNTARITVPATVTIKAGQTTASFVGSIVNNTVVDGKQNVTISAAYDNWTGGSAIAAVADDDGTITLTLPASTTLLWEGQTLPNVATVRIGGTLSTPLVITLTSDDTSELTLPATVTIPAGQTSVSFPLTMPTDGLRDGTQSINITATTSGLLGGNGTATGQVSIHDADPARLAFDPITGSKTAGVGFTVVGRIYNIANEPIAVYSGPALVTAVRQANTSNTVLLPLSLSPTSPVFTNGVTSFAATATVADPAVQLTLALPATAANAPTPATSNIFAINANSVAAFNWGPLPASQIAGVPFSATVTTRDAYGNPASYSGAATISALASTFTAQTIYGSASTTVSTSTLTYGYAFTPNASAQVTAIRSYFGTKVSIWTDTGTLLATTAVSGTPGTWTETPLSAPVTLTAGTRYRIAAYVANGSYYYRTDVPTFTWGTVGGAYSTSSDAFPTGNTSYYPMVDLRANVASTTSVPVTPGSVTFTNGTWTGNVTLPQGGSNVQLRVADTGGHTGDSTSFDVVVKSLGLQLPTDVNEDDGTATGYLSVTPAPNTDLVVSLTSDDPTRLGVPATIVVPAGQTLVPITLSILDNTLLDGLQSVTITATGSSYASGTATTRVHDNESAKLSLTLPTSAREGDGMLTGSVSMSAASSRDLVVQLTASNARLTLPASVTIRAGQTSAAFAIQVVDNALIDGTALTTVSAAADGWTVSYHTVLVADNDATLALTLPPASTTLWEGQTAVGTVRIGGTLSTPLVVSLVSDDTSELSLPATVTIPAGQTSVNFTLTMPADGLHDGSQTAGVIATAAAIGDVTATGQIAIHDADLDHVLIDPITGPKTAGVGFAISGKALNGANEVIAPYAGTASLTAARQAGGTAVSITPTSVTFASGMFSTTATLTTADPAIYLTLTNPALANSVNTAPFAVVAGAISGFAWDPITGPKVRGSSFGASVSARDAYGNLVTSFNGTANMTGYVGSGAGASILITEAYGGTPDAIEFTNVSSIPVDISGWKAYIYDAESYPSPRATVFTFPSGTLVPAGGVFVIQEFGALGGAYPLFNTGENISWTSSSTSAAVLLRNASDQIVDFFAGGTATSTSITSPTTIPISQWSGGSAANPSSDTYSFTRTGTDDHNTAADWTATTASSIGTKNVGLTLPFPGGMSPIPINLTSVTFSNGVWSGNVVVNAAGAGVRLRVTDLGNHTGDSAAFDVLGVSATPSKPDLLAISDSGSSDADDLTNADNAAGRPLQFRVDGTTTGATVSLFADGMLIGSAVATGTSTVIVTDAAGALTDGKHQFTVRQTEAGKSASEPSDALNVTIDTGAPQLIGSPTFAFDTLPQSLNLTFSDDVFASLTAETFIVDGPANTIAGGHWAAVNVGGGKVALQWTGTGPLPDGRYHLTAHLAGLTDAAGNAITGSDVTLDFFTLAGDFNRDAAVDFADLLILAKGYGTTGASYATGDANYDGSVNFDDLLILAKNYQGTLPPSLVASLVGNPTPTSTRTTRQSSRTVASDVLSR